MVIETELPPFWQWLFGQAATADTPAVTGALVAWLQVIGILAAFLLGISYLIAVVRHGPVAATQLFFRRLREGLVDLVSMSPRRVMALAQLAVQEAFHRRVLVAFVVFITILLFAGWYLDTNSPEPARLYLSFVLTTTSYLVLLLALFLSVFSLPQDMTRRTIYTIVTKPVRSSEIVLGRILGFTAVGTLLLIATGAVSYVFVIRGLNHTHELTDRDLRPDDAAGAESGALVGRTQSALGHRHEVHVAADGSGRAETSHGHHHEITAEKASDGRTRYTVGPPEGLFTARVPEYGKLHFKDRAGAPTGRGINVGNEWTYRSYIEGGSLAAAIWEFNDVVASRFGDELPLELNLRVFRTHKGDIERGILGSIVLVNPDTNLRSAPINFVAREYATDLQRIPRKVRAEGTGGEEIDIFDDLASNGRLIVEISCLQREQYFGVAQADVYLRALDASFFTNFVKGYAGIWLQMLLVTSFGVVYSTFLNGSVAMMATAATMLGGFFSDFIYQLATGQIRGGGPAESLYRILTQSNVVVPIEQGPTKVVIEMIDRLFQVILARVSSVLPNFGSFSDIDYVAYGYDIPSELLLVHTVTALGFVVPLVLIGHFFLKTREVAR
ncbi:MAG: ABC transporter permease [Pirellulales bacterium]|nr:ABC transporter permease [Pirellulales bacterium]